MDSPSRPPDGPPKRGGLFTARNVAPGDFIDTVKTILWAFLFAAIFRSLLFEPFHIPSGSMKSNLMIGDYLFVSKFSYGYSHYSFPFGLPYFTGRYFETLPKRGDIIVFRPPGEPDTDFIKRLIGLPGDRIQVKDSVLYINDAAVSKTYVDDWVDEDSFPPQVLKRYQETLPEGKSFYTLYEPGEARHYSANDVENTAVFTVPAGHYFFMGDNRDHSKDSRYMCADGVAEASACPVGFVPEDNLVGRAELVLFSWENGFSFRGDRFFLRLH